MWDLFVTSNSVCAICILVYLLVLLDEDGHAGHRSAVWLIERGRGMARVRSAFGLCKLPEIVEGLGWTTTRTFSACFAVVFDYYLPSGPSPSLLYSMCCH